jgi:hypothetical protein
MLMMGNPGMMVLRAHLPRLGWFSSRRMTCFEKIKISVAQKQGHVERHLVITASRGMDLPAHGKCRNFLSENFNVGMDIFF